MKRISFLFLMLMAFMTQTLCAETLLTPDPAKSYYIQHSSGYLFTKDGNTAKIMSPGAGLQKFKFVPVEGEEGTYNILCEDDTYCGSDGSYTIKFLTDPTSDYAKFTFWQSTEADHAKLWNVGRGGYYGTDNNNDGGGVYSDKSGLDGKHAWKFVEATGSLYTATIEAAIAKANDFLVENQVDELFTQAGYNALNSALVAAETAKTSASTQEEINEATANLNSMLSATQNLLNALRNAKSVLDNAVVGEVTGGYPQDSYNNLAGAIDTAVAAWAESNASAFNAMVTTLNNAVSAFGNTRYVFFAEQGKKYAFINTFSNYALGINSNGEAALATVTGDDNQTFELIPVEGNSTAFNFKIGDGSGYLATKGGWNTTTLTDPEADATKFSLGIVDIDNRIYTINKLNYAGAFASDSNTEGATVFTNKSQSQNNAQWKLVTIEPGSVLTIGLETAIATAEGYLEKAVIGEKPGNYPQEAYDALQAALATAKAAPTTTQQEVNEAAAALNAAIVAFLAEKIDPFFAPEANTAYRFSVRKYESNYITANETKVVTSAYEAGNTLQHFTFVPVQGIKNTFVVKNGNLVLNYDGSMTETADADAPKWSVVYTATVNNVPYFAVVEYDDPTKVMTFGSGTNFAIQNLDITNNAHQTRMLRVDMPHDPKVASLEQAVADARAALAGVTRGSEIGQYTEAKCNAFEATIDEIDALRGLTQDEVNEKTTELNQARTEFINNPNSVIKDELDAAIEAAKAKAAAAEVGIKIGQYYPSQIKAFNAQIAEFETEAKAVSDQDVCDALTAEVNEATEAFVGNTEVQAVKPVLLDVIEWCEELYEDQKDNVGDNRGQRPQSVIDAFAAAIAAAKAISDPVLTDLEALLDARAAFLNGAISQNRTPLRNAIAEAEGEEFANLVAGEFDGNYPQDKIDAFTLALANAKAAEADMSKSQDELDAATSTLKTAMTDLRGSKVVIKFADLDQAIANAEAAIAKVTVIGNEAGQCPQSVIDALQVKLTAAKAIARDAVNQTTVDETAQTLGDAVAAFNTAVVESTGISEAITAAQSVLDDATVGFKPGNYPQAAYNGLQAAIHAALLVSLDNAATQAELIEAVSTLNAAVETFKSQVVPSHDLTTINALIAEAEAFVAQFGNDDYVLALALEDAKNIVADADNYTASEVTAAENNLRKALEYAKANAGVAEMGADSLEITVANGEIKVAGIAEGSSIAIYTIAGQMADYVATADSTYTFAAAHGQYVVVVSTGVNTTSRVVIVK